MRRHVKSSVEKLLEENPILFDREFKKRFPRVEEVVIFINELYRATQKSTGKFEMFDRLGIGNTSEYIELLQQGDAAAVQVYESQRKSLDADAKAR